jgi:hypothetical protein
MTMIERQDLTCDNDTDENSCQVTVTELYGTGHLIMINFHYLQVKGSLTRDFRLQGFSGISFPRAPVDTMGAVRIVKKIRRD